MTPTQRETAERLADRLRHRLTNDMGCAVETASLLRELLAEPQGEPVAWCSLTPSGKIAYFDGKPMVMPGAVGNEVHRTPLYAHPPQQRKPLTREQIDSIWHAQGSFTDRESDYRIFARAIERAITGEPT
jgi:hypothetical protein